MKLTPQDRYFLVKQTRVCPDCGGTVVLLPISQIAPIPGSPDRVGLKCASPDPVQRDGNCRYWIDGGETLADFPGEGLATAGMKSVLGSVRPRADQ